MLDNELAITALNNTYVQNKDPKLHDLIKFIIDNVRGNTVGIETNTKAVTALTTSINNGSLMNSDSVLALISLRV